MALEILSRLHALSAALFRQDPTSMDDYGETLFGFRENGEEGQVMGCKQMERFGSLVDTWDQVY